MFFLIKKIISSFLLPLPFGLTFIFLGLFFLLIHRAKCFSRIALIIGFCVITAFALPPISGLLLNHLQNQYAPLITPPANINNIVVLGGGVSTQKELPPNLTLGASSLSRLVEGIRLFKIIQKTNPVLSLILSGGRVFQAPAVAGKMQNTAVMLGVPQENTQLENGSMDTRDEALFIQKLVGTQPFILVTSAYHMPRAMDLFRDLGMHPIAAPTQFLRTRYEYKISPLPNSNSLITSDTAIHEYLGIVWGKLRGYIKK